MCSLLTWQSLVNILLYAAIVFFIQGLAYLSWRLIREYSEVPLGPPAPPPVVVGGEHRKI
jgi:hypothetical protein